MAAAPAPVKKAQTPAKAAPAKKPAVRAPARVSIPSIALNSRVVPVGVNSKGEMDVPSGSTSDIGWYAKGTVPGDLGSAVMDAHVFAALSRLDEVSAGDDIYVSMADGTTKRFAVTRAQVYKLGDLSPAELFSRKGGRYLHLITCAGELTPDRSTYTHRLVVYATLVE
jgi:sortase (surface protein transpeptidase)